MGINTTDADLAAGKTKISVHQFVDALRLNDTTWTGKPTDAELLSVWGLQGASYDPTNTQVTDAVKVRDLFTAAGDAQRTPGEVEAILRLAERHPNTITKSRVISMLGLS